MPTHLTTPDGTRIAYRDHRPTGYGDHRPTGPATPASVPAPPPILLLHGLAGHQGEWDDLTHRLLADGHRVVTYDARAHGDSTRRPATTTRASHVQDALALIDHLSLTPATLIGQSLGGHTALLLAAAHPARVASLVLVEAGPGGPNPDLPTRIASWLDSWPTPFETLDAAREFLGHEAWARGLERRADGWHPRFDHDRIVACVAELATTSYWSHWSRIPHPTLLVRGDKGTLGDDETTEMLTRRPRTRHTLIPDAGHDVHLDQPARLHEAVTAFLRTRKDLDLNQN
ncbi:alpha/beta hydrolase [Streptomyces sp. NPDC006134]|uniref:alpha/beta fold hydrolase n=1 Tax=Streptomyces sp. NPDC006134 TaxID=3154467 RepID=UPI0033EF8DB2